MCLGSEKEAFKTTVKLNCIIINGKTNDILVNIWRGENIASLTPFLKKKTTRQSILKRKVENFNLKTENNSILTEA
jgi:hypothetical protein